MTKKLDEATKLANKQKREEAKLMAKNEAFNKLSKPQKRVEIAKDVIAQIKAEKYAATFGEYISTYDLSDIMDNSVNKRSLQPLLLTKNYSCSVCQKGALFLSTVRKRNKFLVRTSYDIPSSSDSIETEISDIFTKNQLDLMEVAFELEICGGATDNPYLDNGFRNPTKIAQKAIDFGEKYDYSKDRMIAICQNLINNNGTFKP